VLSEEWIERSGGGGRGGAESRRPASGRRRLVSISRPSFGGLGALRGGDHEHQHGHQHLQ
jgi:hypothetical protein